ncbi:hypothetical protein [Dietzia lutea]|uniref:hypothetical protein n=1 Tax=Dietzia lutea TaxID=546160 RepID=UPI001330A8F9|nr:hypothetical protein [Dietzia lutea]
MDIATFGDAWDVLAEMGSRGRAGKGRGAIVSFGAFRVPTGERRWNYWRLRRKVRSWAVTHIARTAPEVMVIALDARGRLRTDRAESAGARLAEDVRRIPGMLYAHDLPVVVVLIRNGRQRERLIEDLVGGDLGRIAESRIAA